MKRSVAVVAAAVAITGCASLPAPPDRQAVLERIVASSVQLRAELEGDGRRAGSAVVTIQGVAPPAATLKDTTRLGETVWVVGFPWGRRLTVVSGVVSQIAGNDGEAPMEGPARMAPESVLHIPVPGETTLVSAAGIRRFLSSAGLDRR